MSSPPLILIVDDIAANRETLAELLADQNYRLVEAADGPTALRLAAAHPPDLVLLDVMMPDMDGFEVCRRLRADARLAEVPIIMVTALDDQASRLAGLEAGADDFVHKPYHRLELRARVRTVTRLNRYRRLIEQRSQFQWIVEQASEGYVLVDATDEILLANARARLWLGLPSAGGDGAGETFWGVAQRTYHGQPAESWQGWPEIPVAARATPHLLVRPETPQARAFFLEVSVHENTGGRLLRLNDVTERVATRRDQRSFQAMVSHKLRTPLNGLLGSLELLTADPAGVAPAEIAEFAALAQQSAERLNAAVDDVMRFADLSRRPAPDAPFAFAGLETLVRSLAEGLKLPAVTVSVAAEVRSLALTCSPATLEWVLLELLENARKFHPRHTPAVEVSARSERNERVVLTVSDDGVTLSPEQLAQVGRPFFQGEKYFTGEAPGMGLGLANVFALVWQAGGSCQVRNRPATPGVSVELQWPHAIPHEEPKAGAAQRGT